MASGLPIGTFTAPDFSGNAAGWFFVAFTSGSTEPTPGDTIFGDTSNAEAILEYLGPLTSGTWGAGTAAGWMLLSNWNSVAWTSAENFTANSTTPANHGTLTLVPVSGFATLETINGVYVLAFDDTNVEVAIIIDVLPADYSGLGVTATLVLQGAAATGDMSYAGLIRSFTDDVDNLLASSFNAWGTRVDNAAIDAPTVVGEFTYDDLVFADGAEMDNLAGGEFYMLLLLRDGPDGTNDDMVGDGSLAAVVLKET